MAHYAKVPPRAIFRAQTIAVFLNCFIFIGMLNWMVENFNRGTLCTWENEQRERSSLSSPLGDVRADSSRIRLYQCESPSQPVRIKGSSKSTQGMLTQSSGGAVLCLCRSIRCIRSQKLFCPLSHPTLVLPDGRRGRYPMGLCPEIRSSISRAMSTHMARIHLRWYQQMVLLSPILAELL